MKKLAMVLCLMITVQVWSAEKMKFNYVNEELTRVIENYAKATGQKFVIDSTVRGKISILNQSEITTEEAFNQLSEALAVNGFAFIKQGDFYTVKNARAAQRDNVPVSAEVPAAQPQRMATWVVALKYGSADSIQKDIRLLTSSYGEMSASRETNQLVITDWTSNLQRISEMLKQIDKPLDANTAKIVAAQKKEWEARNRMAPPKSKGDVKPPPPPSDM